MAQCPALTAKGARCENNIKQGFKGCGHHPSGKGIGDGGERPGVTARKLADENKIRNLFSEGQRYFYGLEYDYDESTNCSESGCYESGAMCRCSTISNVSVTEVDLTSLTVHVSQLFSLFYPQKDILEYSIERILTAYKFYEPSYYDVEVVGGYYGEEIGKQFYTGPYAQDARMQLSYILDNNCTVLACMQAAFLAEYGRLLPWMEDKDLTFKIVTLPLKSIVLPNENYRDKLGAAAHSGYPTSYFLKDPQYSWATAPDNILGTIGPDNNLIDGYHRTSRAMALGVKKARFVKASK